MNALLAQERLKLEEKLAFDFNTSITDNTSYRPATKGVATAMNDIESFYAQANSKFSAVQSSVYHQLDEIKKTALEIEELYRSLSHVEGQVDRLQRQYNSIHARLSHINENGIKDSHDESARAQEKSKLLLEQQQILKELAKCKELLQQLKQNLSVKQQAAKIMNDQISLISDQCNSVATTLDRYSMILRQEASSVRQQQRGFQTVSNLRFASSASSAASNRASRASELITLSQNTQKLAERYLQLAGIQKASGYSAQEDNAAQEGRKEWGEQFKNNNRYQLKESTEYIAGKGNYHYSTDSRGRIVKCSGTLELHKDTKRNNYAQSKVGGKNRHRREKGEASYDAGGHLIARIFGGSAEIDNIVAMDSSLNRKEYKRMEREWASLLKEKTKSGEQKYKVEVDIRCKYAEKSPETGERNSERPTDIFVYSKITDNETGEVISKKIYRYKNQTENNTTTRILKEG